MPMPEFKRLGSYLVDAGLITTAQVDVALNDQTLMDDMRFGEVLVMRGWIKQQTLDYLITKIVDPEQAMARQTELAEAVTVHPGTPALATPDARSSLPTDRRAVPIAHARSLDGDTVIEIVLPRSKPLVEPPTDPGQINDRKSLPSIAEEGDEMNWVG
jgi:hypothetical protein